MNHLNRRVGWTVANVIVILYAVVPLWWIISLSFKPPSTVLDGNFIPRQWTMDNYKALFADGVLAELLWALLGLAIGAALLGVLLWQRKRAVAEHNASLELGLRIGAILVSIGLAAGVIWGVIIPLTDGGNFGRPLLNSIGVGLITTAIAVLLGTMAAYAIARLEFRGKKLLVGVALLIAMFPQISLVTPLFNIERSLGLFDTWTGLVIPYVAFALPLAIYTLSAFFREIPWDLEKAAMMDGATSAQAFRRVIVPLAAPGVVTAAILVFIFAWNDLLLALSLTSTDRAQTAPVAIANFTGSSQFEEPTGSISAAAVVITIPIIIFVLFFQRRIVAGLTSGAVKG
ncbi:carbohydrate ABC transporter permease [Gordonia alkaliphila]|uniref:carbohydrate ABC transporter permease n=1 Tax=Gordonia alkaliphila TaxID=1053547 RepID=UPI001FF1C66C|nr:carbohydrate ABC transporter permease [Gordonia alkaliphila]MCK0440099.1 carbohydrate ABC transporter permease [Gordonia alkaliphila]